MKATILDFRRRMGDVLRAIEHNETVTVFYRGKEKAVLSPINGRELTGRSIADHPAFGMWSDRRDLEDVQDHIRRLRKGRVDAV